MHNTKIIDLYLNLIIIPMHCLNAFPVNPGLH